MKLGKWAQVAEIISGFAVVVTLLFLILEVQENTSAIRAESYGRNLDRLNTWRMELADNPELTELFTIFQNGDISALTEVQLQQVYFIYTVLWGIYETAFFDRSYDTLAESEWNRFRGQMCLQYTNTLRQELWDEMSRRLNEEFKSVVESDCKI